ncbi:MAG TPA: hypothetical protein VIG44_14045 [Thermomicrobiales bacterium]
MPNADRATIAPDKILRYLLDPTNPRSRGKPALFFALGYTRETWERLRDDLLAHGRTYPVAETEQAGTATVYNVDGELTGPHQRSRPLRTIWRTDRRGAAPRLITAFPSPPGRKEL